MELKKLIDIYNSWKDCEDEPSEDLRENIRKLKEHQSDETDAFFWKIIHDFHENKDVFWILSAIDYMFHSEDKKFAQRSLEEIVGNYEKYGVLGSGISKAASYLGSIADYPNDTLRSAIQSEFYSDDASERLAHHLFQASAFGAYIMTGTDFQTGS